jgi:hypothetical protein
MSAPTEPRLKIVPSAVSGKITLSRDDFPGTPLKPNASVKSGPCTVVGTVRWGGGRGEVGLPPALYADFAGQADGCATATLMS